MVDTLPVIDCDGLEAGDPAAVARVAAAIGAACRSLGFFYVRNHGVPERLIEAVFAASAAFFARPEAEKAALDMGRVGANRGYVAFRAEALDPSRPGDLKEGFNLGFDPPGEPERNAFPDLPGFRAIMLDYFAAAGALGDRLLGAVARDLGVAEDFFAGQFARPMSTLRLLHYPPQPPSAEAGQIGAGEHTDYGCLTLLMTDAVGGLEVRTRSGRWIAAPPVEGAYVVNIGDCLMRWTNDVYVSTPHRVVNRGGRERYSVPFFVDPDPDAVVAAIPGTVAAGAVPKYPPITALAHLTAKLDASYAHRRLGASADAG